MNREDVVDEHQHVLTLHVAEVLGHGQRGQPDPRRVPGGSSIWPNTSAVCREDAGLGHVEEQVVALAGPLADAGEDRTPPALLGRPGGSFS